ACNTGTRKTASKEFAAFVSFVFQSSLFTLRHQKNDGRPKAPARFSPEARNSEAVLAREAEHVARTFEVALQLAEGGGGVVDVAVLHQKVHVAGVETHVVAVVVAEAEREPGAIAVRHA